ncbi:MAG: hypothetical protein WBK10_01865 [Bacillota bacterium]|nr:hypothetical protein [Bacillota bacterium]
MKLSKGLAAVSSGIRAIAGRQDREGRADGVAESEAWIASEIRRVCDQLDQAEHCFDMASDPDMIDAAIYTMRACECRLSYLFGLMGHTSSQVSRSSRRFSKNGVDTSKGGC